MQVTEETTISKSDSREKVIRIIKYVCIYLFLVLGTISVIFPFYWMFSTSFKVVFFSFIAFSPIRRIFQRGILLPSYIRQNRIQHTSFRNTFRDRTTDENPLFH